MFHNQYDAFVFFMLVGLLIVSSGVAIWYIKVRPNDVD